MGPHHLHLCQTLPSLPKTYFCLHLLYSAAKPLNRKPFSSESKVEDFNGRDAYDILGVSMSSSFAEIKASFHKLAKETHPDVAADFDSTASKKFIQILAAYEILSDPEKRVHYDHYLLNQKKIVHKQSEQSWVVYRHKSHSTKIKQMEVVEWLKWYRCVINDILSCEKVVSGSSYFDLIESEFYSAIHRAYYGPVIESMALLPDCFEAEERSAYNIPEVLHLVSGRDLFGIVYLLDEAPKMLNARFQQFTQSIPTMNMKSNVVMPEEFQQMQWKQRKDYQSDAYKDLELHISGKAIAVATRIPPKSNLDQIQDVYCQDHIHVYLNMHENGVLNSHSCFPMFIPASNRSRILLGTISGLRTNPDESSCFVFDHNGQKTHVIMKHRTLMVKHLHWYQAGDKDSPCECRCSRARLPSSK